MDLSSYIDYTNLSKTATVDDIIKLCEDALKYHFQAVSVCTVVGFPNGYQTKEVKQYEAIDAVHNGADEIDMVININALKNKDYEYIKDEIELIRDSIDGKTLKVIIETCLLTDEEIIKMTKLCNETFVHFIKTSTGFDSEGATVRVVELINKNKNDILEIKASGGIKTESDVLKMIEAGATRIGTSHAVSIINEHHHDDKCCDEEGE